MNILSTTLLVGAFSALPMSSLSVGTVPLPTNPIDGLSVSAAGLNLHFDGSGIEASQAESTDFELELRFKSYAPIRVRL